MTVFWVTTIPSEKSAAAEALDLNSEKIRAAVEKGADMGGSIPKIVFKEGVTHLANLALWPLNISECFARSSVRGFSLHGGGL